MSEAPKGLKDRELQKYYEDALATFSTQGWKDFEAHVEQLWVEANTLNNVRDQRDLDFRRGQRDAFGIMKAHEQLLRAAYDNALEDDHAPDV